MSPELIPPAVPIGMIDFEAEITSAWVAVVTAQVAPLSVTTVEERHPQGEENAIRQFRRDELPAVWCSSAPNGTSLEACGVLGLHYTIRWGVLTENGDAKEARREHERIRQNIVALFASYQFQGNSDFLSSGNPVSFNYEQTIGTPTQQNKSPYRVTSENEMRLMVLYPSTPTE